MRATNFRIALLLLILALLAAPAVPLISAASHTSTLSDEYDPKENYSKLFLDGLTTPQNMINAVTPAENGCPPRYGVKISISPSYQIGTPRKTLTFMVMVMNRGNVKDTYVLEYDDLLGWPIDLENGLLIIPPPRDCNYSSEGNCTNCRIPFYQ